MSRKKRLRVVLTNSLLFGLLFGLVSLNKEILRPSLGDVPIVKPALGCFPNFVAAYIISLFFVNGALTLKPMHSRLIVSLGSASVFALLTAEELKPMWGASTRYDVLDIVASGIGATLAVFTYEMVMASRKRASAAPVASQSREGTHPAEP